MATKTTKRTTTARKTTSRAKTGTAANKTAAAKTTAAKTAPAKTAPAKTAEPQTATTSTTAAAPAKAKVTAPAPAAPAASDADKPKVVTDTPVVAGPTLRKKEFIDRVVARAGLKKKDVKPAVEAALAELGEAIARGEEVNLPPFGKLKVNREKDLANAQILICKLRRPKAMDVPPAGKDPLAEAAE